MHGRVSRLRRSLSRSTLFNLSKSQLSLIDLSTPTQNSLLVYKFATPSNFPQLRRFVQMNNEFLREIISIFDERAQLDFAYSKTLQKLSTKLHKISQNAQGTIDQGWTCVAEQFEAQATIHTNLGSAIHDDIVQPLRAIFNSQYQMIRATDQLVDRELKRMNDKQSETFKTKRQLYNWSHDLEKVEQLIDKDNSSNIKLSVKKRKLLEQVTKTEQTYVDETIECEKQRRVVHGVLRKGVERLETIEKQRLAHSQTALGRFQRKMAQLGPNLNILFERHMTSLNNSINADPVEHITNLTPTSSAHHISYLCDFPAENFGEIIGAQRRRWTLERISSLLQKECEKRQENIPDYSISNTENNFNNFALHEFIEFMSFKIDEALRNLNGNQNHREYNRLIRYQIKIRDKTGLPQTILNIPIEESLKPIKQPNAPSLPTTSSIDDNEYDQILANGNHKETFYQANSNDFIAANTTDCSKQICRVLYDFSAKSDDELDISAGDCVIIEDKLGDDWLIGHKILNLTSGSSISKTGRFPTSYVAL